MDESRRWVVGVIAAAAIVFLVLFARGPTDAGRGDGSAPDASRGIVDVRV